MPNYSMKFSVSEVAQILQVDKALIKTWTYTFSDYLSSEANPVKGTPRQFTIADVRVFAYVSLDWEDSPDIEAIKMGLNSGGHHEDIFDEIIQEATPIFRDIPENLEGELQSSVVFGGLSQFVDTFFLADSYKLAGDILIDKSIATEEGYELICPIIYNYRHATELYLKAIVNTQKQTHDLKTLLEKFRAMLLIEFKATPPQWFENIILAFNDFDPNGTAFRWRFNVKR